MKRSASIGFCLALLVALCGQPVRSAPTPAPKVLPISVNGKYGYVDRSGNIVIAPRYDYGNNFREHRATVCVGVKSWFSLAKGFRTPEVAKCRFIDESGTRLGAIAAEPDSYFSDGRAVAKIGKKFGYVDAAGKLVIPARFDFADAFQGGFAAVEVGKKWGYVDAAGAAVGAPRFDSADDFADGLAAVELGDKWGYLDARGALRIRPRFDAAEKFDRGMASVEVGSSWGWIDRSGKLVIPATYGETGNFADGLAAVKTGDKWGFIDALGTMAIPAEYDDVSGGFSEGLAAVKSGEKWGYINKAGVMKIEAQYDYADPFSEGLAPVYSGATKFYTFDRRPVDGKAGFIDTTGRVVIPLSFDFARFGQVGFDHGLALVYLGDRFGYINDKGKYVWQPTK